jgi:putative tryptophan/tyrosine transport system substrate-binding protein
VDRRRFLLTSLAGVFATPLYAESQQAAKMPRIGVLLTLYSSAAEDAPQAFRQGLRALGYVEGQNIAIEWRSAEGEYDRLATLAADLVRLKVDVVVVDVTRAARAAMQATKTIPIVITVAADPVRDRLVSSLAHPGGNLTGLSILLPDISAKRLQLLTEALPSVSRVAVLWNPESPYHKTLLTEVDAVAPSLRLRLVPIAVHGPGEFEAAFLAMAKAQVGALFVADDPMFLASRRRLFELAARGRLPTMFAHREFIAAGGLMSYGPNLSERFRLAGTYVDKILKGAKPADLPVDQAATLEFVINLKTAKALGLTIPSSLLARADQVIE